MTKLFFLLFLMFVGEVKESFFEAPKVYPSKPKSHHFSYVYQEIRKMEGCYVNHPADRGKETYGGISRRNFPDWFGWQFIDQAKPLQRHDSVVQAEFHVKDWYLTRWVRGGFEVIENRDLALNLFDLSIHSSPKTVTRLTNRVLLKMGCEEITYGENWVDSRFNHVDPTEFILRLKIERLKLFNYLVQKDASQRVFYRGWISRIENI